MTPDGVRIVRNTSLLIVSMVVLRCLAAAWTPLTFDEAYYWMWSKHLAFGYYDHPPAVAVVIRLGTMVAGDSELGVRLVSILLALPMSWAVYRTASILFGGQRVASTATILLNVTLMAAVGILIVALSIYLCYRYADRILHKLGPTGTSVVVRLSAFILLCIGVQICWNGVHGLIVSGFRVALSSS